MNLSSATASRSDAHEQHQRIQNAASALLLEEPFYALLLLRLKIRPDASIGTFCTDGRDIRFNPDFCARLTGRQICTVLGEEVIHNAAAHFSRAPAGAEWEVWNLACDQEARWAMQEANEGCRAAGRTERFPWPKPEDAPDAQYRGMAAEAVYARMMAQKPQRRDPKPESGKQKPGSGQSPGPGQGQPSPGGKPPAGPQPGNAPVQTAPQGMADFVPPTGHATEVRELEQEWEAAVLQASAIAKGRGNLPAFAKRLVAGIVQPQADPFEKLREWLSETAREDYDFMRPNAMYADSGFILPSLHSERPGLIVLARDTSGSIDDDVITRMKGVMQWVLDELRPEALLVIDCDARVNQVQVFRPGDDAEVLAEVPQGGGGTSFRPVFDLIDQPEGHGEVHDLLASRDVKALVYLTDLDGTFPTAPPPYPVIWAVWGGKTHQPWGELRSLE